MDIVFSDKAAKEWKRLPNSIQKRLKVKLTFFADQPHPLQFAKALVDSDYGQYRFRIGDYRIIFDMNDDTICVLKVGHRKNIYQ